jgi:adenylate cyclase
MPDIEIERKFVVPTTPTVLATSDGTPMTQGYLPPIGEYSVRIRLTPEGSYLTVKSREIGITRTEVEREIPRLMAEALLPHCYGRILSKRRYPLVENDQLWSIDVFTGVNAGLVLAETELSSEDTPLVIPTWCGQEVTYNERYYNEYLAEHPFTSW